MPALDSASSPLPAMVETTAVTVAFIEVTRDDEEVNGAKKRVMSPPGVVTSALCHGEMVNERLSPSREERRERIAPPPMERIGVWGVLGLPVWGWSLPDAATVAVDG